MVTQSPNITAEDIPVEGIPVFHDPDGLREYLGTQEKLDRIGVQLSSGDERVALLERIRVQSPDVNGNIESAVEQIKLNTEQLQKKESFFRRMAKGVGKGALEVVKFPIKHPFITTAALVGLLYYTGWGAFLAAHVENVVGAIPDGKIKAIIEGLKSMSTGPTPATGVDIGIGLEGTPL